MFHLNDGIRIYNRSLDVKSVVALGCACYAAGHFAGRSYERAYLLERLAEQAGNGLDLEPLVPLAMEFRKQRKKKSKKKMKGLAARLKKLEA